MRLCQINGWPLIMVISLLVPALGLGQSSYIYFQNNTDQTIYVESIQSGGNTLSTSYWDPVDDTLVPWQPSTEAIRVNRTTGITNGEDFYFDVLVHNIQDTVILQMKLSGTFIDSDMFHSAKGDAFDHPWHNDDGYYQQQITFGGKTCTLKYQAALNGLYDDITYVIHDLTPYSTPNEETNPDVLNVLTYNVYMLTPPIAFTDQEVRAQRMVESVSEYDVLFLQETFDNDPRDNYLVPGLETVYPYHTDVLDVPGTPNEDGGVMIFSKFPIETEIPYPYQNCYSYECLTNKGFMYAKVNKLGNPYHLIATHTQAFISEVEVTTRKAQIQEIRSFIDSIAIPTNEPIIVGGDMNVDYYENHYGEYDSMYIYLNAVEPLFTGHLFTFQPDLNYYAESGPDELLDYLLPIADHGMPSSFFNETRILRQIHDDMWGMFDMSDHFAVYGRFEYPTNLTVDQLESNTASLYPNPTSGIIYINEANVENLKVFNLQGQQVEVMFQGQELNLSHLPQGIYAVSYKTGNITRYVKVIKE